MLEKDPIKRPSATKCLKHPFFEIKNSHKKAFFKSIKDTPKGMSLSLTHDALS